jgi:hypothetical protein
MSNAGNDKDSSKNSFRDRFFVTLMEDVLLSMRRREAEDTASARREFVRTTFSAIEGCIWQYREDVRSFIKDIEKMSSITEIALAETSYSVTETGKIVPQIRYIAMPSMFRLITRLAEECCLDLKVDFSNTGWAHFLQAIKIRNRVTHPKEASDLEVSEADIQVTQTAFFWVIDITNIVLEALNLQTRDQLEEFERLLAALVAGDPNAIALYDLAKANLDSDGV